MGLVAKTVFVVFAYPPSVVLKASAVLRNDGLDDMGLKTLPPRLEASLPQEILLELLGAT